MEYYPLYNVSDEQRANLTVLADFLENQKDKIDFSMATFCLLVDDDPDRYNDNSYYVQPRHNCGAVGCAVGYGPSAGILPSTDEVKGKMSWVQYAHVYLGVEMSEGGNAEGQLWDWCFSAGWTDTDNTPQGAAARIRIALNQGIPDRAWSIRRGDDPLPYEVN